MKDRLANSGPQHTSPVVAPHSVPCPTLGPYHIPKHKAGKQASSCSRQDLEVAVLKRRCQSNT